MEQIYIENTEIVSIQYIQLGTDQEGNITTSDLSDYRRVADIFQNNVYNSAHSAPSEDCLLECSNLIACKLGKRAYAVRFALYEGQADTLRTSKCLDENLWNHPVYKCLELLAPYTSFPCIALMIYKFRYGSALAVCGRIQDGKREAEKGMEKLQAFLNDTSMARINASCLYGYINVLLACFCNSPDVKQKMNILDWIEKGLIQAKTITESEVSNMWMRMFLVKRAYCLLRIGLSGDDIHHLENSNISREDRERARQSLQEAEEHHWTNTDNRRQMLCKRAKAKLHFLDGDNRAAQAYLREAINLAKDFKREEQSYNLVLQKWAR